MRHQKRYTTDNKVIDIYDDVFSQAEREYHVEFTYKSKYTLNNAFGGSFWIKDKKYFCLFI